MRKRIRAVCLYCIVSIGFGSPTVLAESAGLGGGSNRYNSDWFVSFAPRNAMDMVERLPGFVLAESDNDLRGFAQAAGNLVINGQRPSTKNESLGDLLLRIPADQVAYLEVLRGETLGGEYRSVAQVANVVLRSTQTATTSLQGKLENAYVDSLGMDLSVSHLRRSDDTTLTGSIRALRHPRPDFGTDHLRTASDARLIEFRDKDNRWVDREFSASLGWERRRDERDNERVNFSFERSAERLDHVSAVLTGFGGARSDTITLDPLNRSLELSGDLTRPVGAGALKVVGVAVRRSNETDDLIASYLPGRLDSAGLLGGNGQNVRNRSGETLLRTDWTLPRAGWGLEFGAEVAINTLKSRLGVFALGADGSKQFFDIPGDNVDVKEKRLELGVSGGRDLAGDWRLDLALTAEASRLEVSGDSTAERSLRYLKPSASVAWKQGPWVWHLRGLRTVSQLDFNDFASFAEVTNSRITTGNSELVPQQEWRLESTLERGFGQDARAKLVISAARVSEVQDRVPLAGGFDGPGNLGDGRRYSAELTWDSSLALLGLTNARVRFNGYAQESQVRDPYTGRNREFANELPWRFTAGLKQTFDARKLAWGLDARLNGPFTSYRRSEIDQFRVRSPYVDGYVEYRNSAKLTTEIGIQNLLDSEQRRFRVFSDPDRFSPTRSATELRVRHSDRTIYLRVKGELG